MAKRRRGVAVAGVFVLWAASFPASADELGGKPTRQSLQEIRFDPKNPLPLLENAERIDLIRVDPSHRQNFKGDEPRGLFLEWTVLGRTTIRDAATKRRLLDSFAAAIKRTKGTGLGALCFEPRHILHAEGDELSVDVAICFHCANYAVFLNGKPRSSPIPMPNGDRAVFDEVLAKAGLKIPDSAEQPRRSD